MSNFKKVYFSFLSSLLLVPAIVSAQGSGAISELEQKIDRVVGFLQTLLLSLAAIFIIIAAYKYMTAQGDTEKVKDAKNMLLYTVIAVVIALLATGVVDIIQAVLGA